MTGTGVTDLFKSIGGCAEGGLRVALKVQESMESNTKTGFQLIEVKNETPDKVYVFVVHELQIESLTTKRNLLVVVSDVFVAHTIRNCIVYTETCQEWLSQRAHITLHGELVSSFFNRVQNWEEQLLFFPSSANAAESARV